MSSTPTRCIALTMELEKYLRAQVASGHYASASEVVRSALRLMIEREQAGMGNQRFRKKPESSRETV